MNLENSGNFVQPQGKTIKEVNNITRCFWGAKRLFKNTFAVGDLPLNLVGEFSVLPQITICLLYTSDAADE